MEENFETITPETYLIKYNVSKQQCITLEQAITNDIKVQEDYKIKLEKMELAHELLTKLKQFKMDSKKDFILKTINTALTDIFEEDIKIDIEAMSNLENGKINMKYDIVLYQNGIEIARNEKLIESNGGGVLSIISILFKMLVGFIYSENKFYMFDESLSQVSADYRPRLSKFLQEFCNIHGFTIILVSHTEELDIHANLVYSLSGSFDKENIPVLNIQEIIGKKPEDEYIYAKIKNFQSIVDLEFRFKGFTIIRGSNNIGKSATLRAINAVIFNDFSKSMQRITNARSIETSIEFGHFKKDDPANDTKKIKVSYKSQKVNYEFDGMVFSGKNLAFDKVQEKIESIGFKYINLKETYKNFKGNLKDQTERLSLTTQHDGLFLIGSKNTDSSKIFDFLFDSYQVASAIQRIKMDINEFLSEYNNLEVRIINNKKLLKREKIKETLYSMQYYTGVIDQTNGLHKTISYKNYILDIHHFILDKINKIISINKSQLFCNSIYEKLKVINNNTIMIQLEKINKIIFNLKNNLLIVKNITWLHQYKDIVQKLNPLLKIKENIELIILKARWVLYIEHYKGIYNSVSVYKNIEIANGSKIEIIKNILNKYSFLKMLNNYTDFLNNLNSNQSIIEINNLTIKINTILTIINTLQTKLGYEKFINSLAENINYINHNLLKQKEFQDAIILCNNNLNGLENEFGLEKCKHCNGVGYSHKH